MTTAWLRDLEERVQEASERLRTLRAENLELSEKNTQLSAENERLEARVSELEDQLAQVDTSESGAWQEEREEIRGRVEKLVEHLGTLLTEEG